MVTLLNQQPLCMDSIKSTSLFQDVKGRPNSPLREQPQPLLAE